MRIVVADDDAVARKLIAGTIERRTQHEVLAVAGGQEVLEACFGASPPDVLVLDWEMPDITGPEVCRRLRAGLEHPPYLLMVTVRDSRRDVIEGLAAGADDMLSKPVAPDLLLARLALGTRRRRTSGRHVPGLWSALQAASREGSGELVIREGSIAARVYFCEGKVGWIQVVQEPGSLVEVLSPATNIDAETARAVSAECRRTSTGYGEVLVKWGMLERAQLRECLQQWLSRKLSHLLELEAPATLFLPEPRPASADMLFSLEELAPGNTESLAHTTFSSASATHSEPFILAEEPPAQVAEAVERCGRASGFTGAVCVDRLTGLCLIRRGEEPDPDIVWSLVRQLSAMSRREEPETCVVKTVRFLYFACFLPCQPGAVLCVRLSRSATSLGVAWGELRASIAAACS